MARSSGPSRGIALAMIALAMFVATLAGTVGGLVALGLWALRLGGESGGPWRGLALSSLSFLAAAVVLRAAWPRPPPFTPPGPAMTPRSEPALFEELRRAAQATGEALPLEVYLYDEPNAFVTEVGGVLGFGARRVMAIGLPLLTLLEVSELRAVLVHELAHFAGGDTRAGRWLYRVRLSMASVLTQLDEVGRAHGLASLFFSAVRLPFRLLAGGFLAASRRLQHAQELAADRVAAKAEGAAVLVAGLRKTSTAGLAYLLYHEQELEPLLAHGVLPPIHEGFTVFLRSERVRAGLARLADLEEGAGASGGDHSHPSLRQRLAAAARIGAEQGAARSSSSSSPGPTTGPTPGPTTGSTIDRRPATALLASPSQYEAALQPVAPDLRRVSWAETGQTWVQIWRDRRRALDAPGISLTAAEVPAGALELRVLMRKATAEGAVNSDEQVRRWAVTVLGAALVAAAADAGFNLENAPGATARLVRGDQVFEPFSELDEHLEGKRPTGWWRGRCAELGLSDAPLGRLDE